MGEISHEGITFQNDTGYGKALQVTPGLPFYIRSQMIETILQRMVILMEFNGIFLGFLVVCH
jgi:hypothetical protein